MAGFYDSVMEGGADVDFSDPFDVIYDYDGDDLGVSGIAGEVIRRDTAAIEYVGTGVRDSLPSLPDVDVSHYFDGITGTIQSLSDTAGKAVVVYGVMSIAGLYVSYKAGIPQAVGRVIVKVSKAVI